MALVVNPEPAGTDPILQRRARVARLVKLGQRVGYGSLLLAIVGFVIAALTNFAGYAVTLSVVGLVGACVILPVPIVLGYGVRAAERDERRAAQGLPPGGH
jgi:hypothetical protein